MKISKIKFSKASVSLLLCILTVSIVSTRLAAETLRDKNGEIMRGTRMVIGKPYRPGSSTPTVERTIDYDHWVELKSMGFNTVRVVWVDPFVKRDPKWTPKPGAWWEVDEMLPYLDSAVKNATESGMNIIINYHNVGEYIHTKGFGMMAEFWQKVAPRYKDNALVYFELNNEQTWNSADYFNTAFKSTMRSVYQQVRTAAPKRHIIMFSFNSMGQPMKAIADDYAWVDWGVTSVGFHFYGWQTQSEESELANLNELINSEYTTICTEWGYNLTEDFMKPYYGYQVNAQALEQLKQSWIDWRDWSEMDLAETRDLLIPDAKSKGYWWADATVSSSSGNLKSAIPK